MRDEDKTREELLSELQRTRIHMAHLMEAEALRRQAERDLEQLTHIAAAIVTSSPCGLLVVQRKSPERLVLVNGNPQIAHLMGIAIDQLRGTDLEDLWPETANQGLKQALLDALDTGEVFEIDHAPYTQHSVERLFRVRAFPMPDERVGVYVEDTTCSPAHPVAVEALGDALWEPLEPILDEEEDERGLEHLRKEPDEKDPDEETASGRDEELAGKVDDLVAQLSAVHARLAEEMERRRAAEEAIATTCRDLENRVKDRTEELSAENQSLENRIAESLAEEEALRGVRYELEKRLKNQEYEIAELAEALEIEIAEHKKTEERFVAVRIELETRMTEVDEALESTNKQLREQIVEKQRIEDDLRTSLAERERLVHELSARLSETTECLDREKALHESIQQTMSGEGSASAPMQYSQLGMAAFDTRGMITALNPRLVEMFGATSAEDLRAINLPDSSLMQESGLPEAIQECLQSGVPSSLDCPLTAPSGKRVYARVYLAPVRRGHEEIDGCEAIFEDVSEAQATEMQTLQAERLCAHSRMAGGVATKFSDVVEAISGQVQEALACVESANFSDMVPLLESLLITCSEAGRTIRRLKQCARTVPRWETSQRNVFDLTEVIRETIEMDALWSRPDPTGNGRDVTVEPAFSTGCLVEGEEDDFIEIMANLLENAAEASPGGGIIGVETFLDREEVVVNVRDEGIGIPRNHMPHLFEPFWTSKEGHDGLGLSVVFGLVRRNRGTMKVSGAEERGALVTLRFPRAQEALREEGVTAAEPARGNYRILLIYSLKPVARMLQRKLTRLGYRIFVAHSVQEGIEVLKRTKIQAIVCDFAEDSAMGSDVSDAVQILSMETGFPKPRLIVLAESVDQRDGSKPLSCSALHRVVEKPVSVARLVRIVAEEIRDVARRFPEMCWQK
jgi:PAS domain S-box-containing protein